MDCFASSFAFTVFEAAMKPEFLSSKKYSTMVTEFHREDSTPDWKTKTDQWIKADTGLWVASYEVPRI